MAFSWFKKTEEKTPDPTATSQKSVTQNEAPPQDLAVEPLLTPENSGGKSPPADTAAADVESEPFKEPPDTAPTKSGGFFSRLKSGLAKTRKILSTDIEDLFSGGRKIDDDLLEELEELLITSDIGVKTTQDLIEHIERKASKISDAAQLKEELKSEMLRMLEEKMPEPESVTKKPHVIMVVGVNGVGKTTTIGKLASKFSLSGKKVLIAAADTFRAAAIEQLSIWAERADAEIVRHRDGSDPAAVAYDGMEAAVARNSDVVLVDTAGRLHTKINLMEELKKIKRAVSKKVPGAPHEILLVLDATTGQNGLSQAKLFNEALDITAIALTKLDGTAKGGIVIAVCNATNIPLKYIGVGEKIDDLQMFDPVQFVQALF